MGRRRTPIPGQPDLPPRVYLHHGAYRYYPRVGKLVHLGRDYAEAMAKWAAIAAPEPVSGTVAALLQWYLSKVASKKAPRTFRDNQVEARFLIAGLGAIPFRDLKPHHVATYRDARAEGDPENGVRRAPVRANREKALLSHAFTKAVELGWVDTNPCAGVRRNPERKRDRMIDDAEYQAVYARAIASVRIAMRLIYRTAQRVEDLLQAGPANVKRIEHEGRQIRVLRITQGKTGTTVDIALAGELEEMVDAHLRAKVVRSTFVHTRHGRPYTYDGIAAMFRRYCGQAGVEDFGLYDLKAKAATDMYRAGVPLERIQQLLGHDSITTTERYIKARLADVVQPNLRAIGG